MAGVFRLSCFRNVVKRLNFLRDRLVKTFNVPEDEDRRLSYKTRLDLIWRAWNSTDFQKLLEAMQ